jgi:WD40 repeat protein
MARFVGTDSTAESPGTKPTVSNVSDGPDGPLEQRADQLSFQRLDLLSGQADSFGFDGEQLVDLAIGGELGGVSGGVTIVRMLAEGGMGRVYEGRQHSPDRLVAVKVLKNGLASRGMMKRFEQEAHLLARLRHPHIAQVYTAGTCRHGSVTVPFFVMELVAGALPIDRFARDRVLTVRQRVLLLRRVAGAVAYGHRLGIVHRDLKPGNILVDADGEPKVIDFGVARTTDADLAMPTLQTDAGQLVGTLRYMSPEQFDADACQIDRPTDVYSLGLVLHELLVGKLPYDVRGQSIVVAARIIREQEPRVAAMLCPALTATSGLSLVAARQLAAIIEKCLQKRPADRYATADELEAELAAWLAGEPVRARPPTVVERAGRLLRRHRLAVAAAALVGLAGLAAAMFSSRARHQELVAERHRAGEQAESYYADVQRAASAADRRNIPIAASLVERARAITVVPGRPVEIDCLAARLDDSLLELRGHDAIVRAVAATRTGDWLATGDDQGMVRLWKAADRGGYREARRFSEHRAPIWSAAFAPTGLRLVTAGNDGVAIVRDVVDGRLICRLEVHPAVIYGVAFAPDGREIATASSDGRICLWDAERGDRRAVFTPNWQSTSRDQNIYGVAFSGRGDQLAAACGDGVIRRWTVATGEPLPDLRGHTRRVFSVAFSPVDGRLASAAEDGTARLWDTENVAVMGVLRHPLRVNGVAWTADGSGLATVSADAILRLWSSKSGVIEQELVGHRDVVWAVTGLPASGFVTSSADTTARVWGVGAANEPIMTCGNADAAGVRGVACSPDGRLVATATAQGRVRLWDLATCTANRDMPAVRGRVNAVDFAPAGDHLAAACGDGTVRVYTVADGEEVTRLTVHSGPVFAAVFSPDGQRIASAGSVPSGVGEQGAVRIVPSMSDTDGVVTLPHPARALGAAWSPDGRRLATACADGLVREWDPVDGRMLGAFEGHADDVNWVAWSRDGVRVASGSSDGTVRLWKPADGWSSVELKGPVGQVWEVAFSPDNTRIAGVGADGSLHLWHTESGRHIVALDGHEGPLWGVVFSPDGRTILTGSDDGTTRVWGTSPAELHRQRLAVEP